MKKSKDIIISDITYAIGFALFAMDIGARLLNMPPMSFIPLDVLRIVLVVAMLVLSLFS